LASLAIGAILALASPCLAQDSTEAVADVESLIGNIPGRGGIGGQFGTSYFRFDRLFGNAWFTDYSAGARPRFTFSGHFRYVFTPWFRVQLSPGFTWAGYNSDEPAPFADPNFDSDPLDPRVLTKSEYLTLLVPVSLQAQYVVTRGRWLYYVGAGPGLYRVWVENDRKVLKDPDTKRLHRGIYLGGSAQFGVERFLSSLPSTSIELSLAGHLAIAERDEQFTSGYNSNVMAVELRVGANYYFLPGERAKEESEGPDIPPP